MNVCGAAKRGDLHTLLDAFRRGLPVDVRDKYFKTPLMVAAAKGDLTTARFLLGCGAEPNAYDNFKWTALHHACHTGQLEVVRALVEAGADVNALSMTQVGFGEKGFSAMGFELFCFGLAVSAQLYIGLSHIY